MTVVASVVAAVETAVVTSVVGTLVPENYWHHIVMSPRNHYFFQIVLSRYAGFDMDKDIAEKIKHAKENNTL